MSSAPSHRCIDLLAILLAAGLGSLLATSAAAQAEPVAVTGVRVFTGDDVVEKATVIFRQGKIAAVGEDIVVPAEAEVIEGAGKTLLPGLIDGHVHTFGASLEHALNFGVTTVLDMFTAPTFARSMRELQAEGKANQRADLFSTGYLTTAKGGHGTQFGMPVPTLDRAEDAAEFIQQRVDEGADFIKLIYEDGTVVGRPIPTLDLETLTAAIEAAHALDKLAVVHVSTWQKAKEAIGAGADGLVHIHYDKASQSGEFDAELVKIAKANGVFVVPTLSVLQSATGGRESLGLAAEQHLAPFLPVDLAAGLGRTFPDRGASDDDKRAAAEAVYRRVGALERAGVPILAGTDAPNPGTAFGISMHGEMVHLSRAGLSPRAALAAATSRPADAFGLEDRGRIAVGKKADLVLVEGDPTTEITRSQHIVAIWKDGVRYQRKTYDAPPDNDRIEPGSAGSFDDATLSGDIGSWMPSTDQMAGGSSTVELDYVRPGAKGTAGGLLVRGEMKSGFAFPWAGPMLNPGTTPMVAVDLSLAQQIVFSAKGEGTLRVLVFAESLGMIPAEQRVELSSDWQEFALDFEDFRTDGSDLLGVHFSASELGPFEFAIDEVAFQ